MRRTREPEVGMTDPAAPDPIIESEEGLGALLGDLLSSEEGLSARVAAERLPSTGRISWPPGAPMRPAALYNGGGTLPPLPPPRMEPAWSAPAPKAPT